MTKLLEEAFARATQLPESEQDALAQIIMAELESERRWDELFARSPDKLTALAEKAWADHEAGKAEPLDPDTL